jgi:hypothetical protein
VCLLNVVLCRQAFECVDTGPIECSAIDGSMEELGKRLVRQHMVRVLLSAPAALAPAHHHGKDDEDLAFKDSGIYSPLRAPQTISNLVLIARTGEEVPQPSPFVADPHYSQPGAFQCTSVWI